MMKISLSDYIRDVLNEQPSARCEEVKDEEHSAAEICPGCGGHGRYVGFRRVEDPCRVCGGTGRARDEDRCPE